MKKNHEVLETLFLVLQVGITMMVTFGICFGAGYFIDKKFGTKLIFFFIVLGILSGYRAVYLLIKKHIHGKEEEPEEWVKKAFNKDDEDKA